MDFVIAIPSYNRAQKLRQQTLQYLEDEGIPPAMITVFVASEAEKRIYEQTLVPGSYGSLVVGVLGLHNQRNFIKDYYAEDVWILQMDDDIKKIKFLNQRSLIALCHQMFQITEDEGARLWSIYPVNNLFFCKERVVVGKIFCIGCCFGIINKKDVIVPSVSCVDDKWRSLYCYTKDGATVRYDGACPDTVYNTKGGLFDHRLLFRTQEVREVALMFPGLCHVTYRKNGVAEVKWKPQVSKILSLPPA
jgi:hypothetical protein